MLSLGMFNHSSDLGTGKASALQYAMLKLYTREKKKNSFWGCGGGKEAEGRREEDRLNEH